MSSRACPRSHGNGLAFASICYDPKLLHQLKRPQHSAILRHGTAVTTFNATAAASLPIPPIPNLPPESSSSSSSSSWSSSSSSSSDCCNRSVHKITNNTRPEIVSPATQAKRLRDWAEHIIMGYSRTRTRRNHLELSCRCNFKYSTS